MPSGTNFKLRAEIGPYKQAMTEAKAATKTLDAELKLAQAQFKATGDAEQYLDTRSKVLAQQMTQQQKAADAARSALEQMRNAGVEPTNAAYQNMERAMYEAERQMVQLRQEADKTGDEVLNLSKDSDKLTKSLDSIGQSSKFTAIASGFTAISSIAQSVWSKVQGIASSIGEAAQWADELITRSVSYGLTPEELQQYEYAAQFVDTDVDSILKARDRLMQKSKGEDFIPIVDGMTGYAVALKDAAGNARDTMDVFWDFIDVLGQMQDATSRDQVAQEYFGKSFRDLIPLIKAGRETWNQYMSEALTVSDENVTNLGNLDDATNRLKSSWDTLWKTTVGQAAPAITALLDVVTDTLTETQRAEQAATQWAALPEIEKVWETWGRDLTKLSEMTPGTSEYDKQLRRLQGFAEQSQVNTGSWALALGTDFDTVSQMQKTLEQQINAIVGNAGSATVEQFAAGVTDAASAAYAAGAAVGSAAAAGIASAAGGNTTNNSTTQNFGDTYNYYSNGYEGYTEEQQRQLAGYGG